jgi:hypothetical protein
MIQGWLREDGQAVVEREVVCSDRSRHTVPAIIGTGFNGQVSLARHVVDALDPPLTYEGMVEVELASGTIIEEDIYSGTVRGSPAINIAYRAWARRWAWPNCESTHNVVRIAGACRPTVAT